MSDRETAHLIRGIVARAVALATNDGGETQTADLKVYHGVDRSGVEILQPFGLASRPPKGGPVIALAVGGDQGDLVGLPIAAPGVRLGFLEEGDVAIYTLDGSRVLIKRDGTIHVTSNKKVHARIPGDEVAEIELEPELIRARIGEGAQAPRWVVRKKGDLKYVKLRVEDDWLIVEDGAITVSQPPVVGPDPEPEV